MRKLGLANEVQELKSKLEEYEKKDKEREQDVQKIALAVYEGMTEIANAAQEQTPATKPSVTLDPETKKLLEDAINSNKQTSPTKPPAPKRPRRNPKNNSALYTPPEKTEGAVCEKVNGCDKWTATIMNKNKNVTAKEERIWCQPCKKWILQTYTEHWTGTHDDWIKQEKERLRKKYEEKVKTLPN